MTFERSGHRIALLGLILLAGALGGCGGKSDEQLIASAKDYIAQGKHKDALIELKTAVQANPASPEGRYLLGKTLLDSGDAVAAAVELDKARSLDYDENKVLPPLSRALLVTGGAKTVTDLYASSRLSDPIAAAELKAVVAKAFFTQGQLDRARAVADAALQMDPKNVEARLLQARLVVGAGDFDKSMQLTKVVLADAPKRSDAWQLLGELLWVGKGDLEGAKRSFNEALALDPRFMPAHIALISIALQTQDIPGFKAQYESLAKALPDAVETRFYAAQLQLLDGNYRRARELIEQLLKIAPENSRVLQLAAAIEMDGGSLILAQSYLFKALQANPGLETARRLLAEANLRSGEPTKALNALRPLLEGPSPGADVLSLAAQAYLQKGDLASADANFTRASKADPADPKVRTALALTDVAKGNVGTGIAQLEALSSSDKSTYADLALVSLRLRRGELNEALIAIDHLKHKMPGDPLPDQLRGQIFEQREDFANARAAYERALGFDKAYFPAIAALGRVDIAQGKLEAARQRYKQVLDSDPRNYQALLALIDLRRREGAEPKEINKLLQDAVASNPGEAAPWVMLGSEQLGQGDARGALTTAQNASASLPDDPQILDLLGRALLASGDVQQAIVALEKVAAAQPNSPQPLAGLYAAYMRSNDPANAERSLRKAVDIDPGFLPAQQLLVHYLQRAKRNDDAIEVARRFQKERPADPWGYALESQVDAGLRRWDPAITLMQAAIAHGPTSEFAVDLHSYYIEAGRNGEADKFGKEWLQTHPQDSVFMLRLGSLAVASGRIAEAESIFRRALEASPKNSVAMNNIAWTLVKQNKKGAVEMAQRAIAIDPKIPTFFDTLAMAWAAEGRLADAVKAQRQAVALQPTAPRLRLALAELLIRSGDRSGARVELETLKALGSSFDAQDEVSTLMKTL